MLPRGDAVVRCRVGFIHDGVLYTGVVERVARGALLQGVFQAEADLSRRVAYDVPRSEAFLVFQGVFGVRPTLDQTLLGIYDGLAPAAAPAVPAEFITVCFVGEDSPGRRRTVVTAPGPLEAVFDGWLDPVEIYKAVLRDIRAAVAEERAELELALALKEVQASGVEG